MRERTSEREGIITRRVQTRTLEEKAAQLIRHLTIAVCVMFHESRIMGSLGNNESIC